MVIVGRQYEQTQLRKIFESDNPEFVAVYGRRRVGKTYLIREFFAKKNCIFFRATGIHKASLKKQLSSFKKEIENIFYKERTGTRLSNFTNWHNAFEALKDAIEIFSANKKVVIFLDEIPWMASPKSELLESLDYYWNRYWSENKKIKLIICGSAASWIINKVLHDTGGLHNRVTLRLPIEPFTLAETKAYLKYKKIVYNNEQILTLYMCLGGIPYYLNYIEKGLSAIQNINNACFNRRGTLYDEFEVLFASLFKNHEIHEQIIKLIASKRQGMSRTEIESTLQYKGGRLTDRLQELIETRFIISFLPWNKERGISYKVIDEYTLFYLTWIAPRAVHRIHKNVDDHYWEILSQQSSWQAWSGYAFEAICFKHLTQIMQALNIPNSSEVFPWQYIPNKADKNDIGAQVDLIFDRPDNIINLCEIKYCNSPFKIDKKYAKHIENREEIYLKITKTRKQIFNSIIASYGLKKTMYNEIIHSIATLSDLFKE